MISDLQRRLEVIVRAAEEAGAFIRSVREGGNVEIQFKGARDLLTQADTGAEKIVMRHIQEAFPNERILSEEASPVLDSADHYLEPLWVIDPVDGTTNFAQGHYQVGVSIAFAIGGEVQVGAVYAPFLNEMFTAIRGQGASCNGKPIACSKTVNLENSLIATGFPYKRDNLPPVVQRLDLVLQNCRDVRRLGAASLDICWVACGRIDGFYESLAPWDMAAGCLIARESGAIVGHSYDVEGRKLPLELCGEDLVVAGGKIFEQLRELVAV